MESPATQKRCWVICVLLFIFLRTLFALIWDVATVEASDFCFSFASYVFNFLGVTDHDLATCEKDEQVANIGTESGSSLVLDMGEGNEIVDGPGVDFYYYERPYGVGILLDHVEVSVAQADNSADLSFITVFIWGDENSENNGEIPDFYFPEDANRPINSSDLHEETGIGINIGNDDWQLYRFIRFQTYPNDAIPPEGQLVEVDAVERVYHPPPTPTPTQIPMETPLPTQSEAGPPTDSPTLTDVPTSQLTFIPPSTDTLTLTSTNSETPEATGTSIATPTVEAITSTLMPSPSATWTFTESVTPTEVFSSTISPSATYTLSAPSISTLTSTLTTTLSPTASNTGESTPITTSTQPPTQIPRPKPTRTSTATPLSHIPGTPKNTLIPSETKRPTKIITATLTKYLLPTKTYAPTITLTRTLAITPQTMSTTQSTATLLVSPTPEPSWIGIGPIDDLIDILLEYVARFLNEEKQVVWAAIILGVIASIVYTLFIEKLVERTRDSLLRIFAMVFKLLTKSITWLVKMLWKGFEWLFHAIPIAGNWFFSKANILIKAVYIYAKKHKWIVAMTVGGIILIAISITILVYVQQ